MKKFIVTLNFIAIIALVPAVIVGYLHNDSKKDSKNETELAKDVNNSTEEGLTLRLIKTF
jgi:hypothetical protein